MSCNNNCNCTDNVTINNTTYTVISDSWSTSYLCDFMAAREDNAAEKQYDNPPAITQGMSIIDNGKKAVVYLINGADDDTSRCKMILIDLTSYTILDVVERNTATDDTTRRLYHANGATNYVDINGDNHTVTVARGYAFDTIIANNTISAATYSKPLYIIDNSGNKSIIADMTYITHDVVTNYWYIGYNGNVYQSTVTAPTVIPDNYKYLCNTGMYTTDYTKIQSLRNQGCMIINQSACARDGILYGVLSAPAVFAEFSLDSTKGEVGSLLTIHNMNEYATGHIGVENECIGWSDYLNAWVVNTNGRYMDEVSTVTGTSGKAHRVYTHIALWAVGNTVGINAPQTYSTTSGTFTVLAGLPRHIYCTLDDDIMHDGYKIGEYIRHDGYADSPFRSIGDAFAMADWLKNQSAHQTVYIDIDGDFARYVKSLDISCNATLVLTNGSTLPPLTIFPNISLSLDTDKDSAIATINNVIIRRGAALSCLHIHIKSIDIRAGGRLSANALGDCTITASGQNVIVIGATDNNLTGQIHGAIAFVGGGYDNLTFDGCVNLAKITTGD